LTQTPDYEVEKSALIAEIREAGIKHSPEKIVRIAKRTDGKIIFLEEGKLSAKASGLLHILKEHKADFGERGISEDQIPDAVMAAVIRGTFIRYQGKKIPLREVYEVTFNGQLHYISVTVGDNGYIVGANPASL
jgi:hypothetical protein